MILGLSKLKECISLKATLVTSPVPNLLRLNNFWILRIDADLKNVNLFEKFFPIRKIVEE